LRPPPQRSAGEDTEFEGIIAALVPAPLPVLGEKEPGEGMKDAAANARQRRMRWHGQRRHQGQRHAKKSVRNAKKSAATEER
jgi:hypothetical protein